MASIQYPGINCRNNLRSRRDKTPGNRNKKSLQDIIESQEKLLSSLQKRVKALENNVSKGADTRKYGCRVRGCNARYNRQDNLSRHMKESCDAQHKRVASTMNRRFCKQCERIFIRQCDFSRHMRSKHSDIDLGACDEEDTEQFVTYPLR